jgi:hypothetical protein
LDSASVKQLGEPSDPAVHIVQQVCPAHAPHHHSVASEAGIAKEVFAESGESHINKLRGFGDPLVYLSCDPIKLILFIVLPEALDDAYAVPKKPVQL